jgi:ferredoxin--NADP+ reductase/benzoate/toluate 1,2-dioxygenase reductase subunit
MKFVAGQHLSVGKANEPQAREYSIYSAETDSFLEILVKEVEDGTVSKQLKRMKVGDPLRVQGPMGFFKLDESKINNAPHLFIATGTGISPFHSFIMSYPKINYIVIHGVRTGDEGYERFHFDEDRYLLCTSRDNSGNFHGRSTSYLKTIKLDPKTQVYLCGNCDMIFEAYDILSEKGIPTENIHTEVYF